MFQSTLSRVALAIAGGALAAVTAAGPALAAPAAQMAPASLTAPAAAPMGDSSHHFFKGRVISNIGLNVRAEPGLGGEIIGSLPPGTIVKIICKVNSTVIDGNPRWYKIKFDHGTGWVAARYVENIGEAPNFCHR